MAGVQSLPSAQTHVRMQLVYLGVALRKRGCGLIIKIGKTKKNLTHPLRRANDLGRYVRWEVKVKSMLPSSDGWTSKNPSSVRALSQFLAILIISSLSSL